MAVWFSGIGFASWKLLEPFRGPLVVSPRSSVHSEGHTSPVRGSDPRHDVHRPGCRGSPAAPAWMPARPPPPPPASPPPSPAPLSLGCCALGFLIWFSVSEAGMAVRINQQIGGA